MEHDNSLKKNTEKNKSRLDNPILRLASVLVAFAAIVTFVYSVFSAYFLFPLLTVLFFLTLWFLPPVWSWIEYVFSRRPSSKLGRFTLNLVLAILMASVIEDVLELIIKFARFLIG